MEAAPKKRRTDDADGGAKQSKLHTFLAKLGLEQYTTTFVAKGLTPKHVRKMSDAEMQEQLDMPKEHVWLLKRALGEPSNQPGAQSGLPKSAAAAKQPEGSPDALGNAAAVPGIPPGPPADGTPQDMMLKMMQLQQNAGQTSPAGADGMPPPESEEELMMMQMQMQMQMQVQMAIEAGADPTKALEAMGGLLPEATGQAPAAPSDATAQAAAAAAATNDKPVAMADGGDTMDNTMYAIGQVAEESAQLAVSAAAFCSNGTATDPVHIQALAEAAQQAAQRARWAACTMESYEPAEGVGQNWTSNIRSIGVKAAEAAENAAQQCLSYASGGIQQAAFPSHDDDPTQPPRMPCKFFLLGRCWKGAGCEFSHEQPDLKPIPIHQKREEECVYFAKGHCTRGVACPFAHGPDELSDIIRYKAALKKEGTKAHVAAQTTRFRRG
mmetsp:Transcript_67952/g.112594  ORF Transcript_67952/g.112594 Transcript_67952/m.112594 type:complete len:439 (-) Transcript_67952:60-1376(-)